AVIGHLAARHLLGREAGRLGGGRCLVAGRVFGGLVSRLVRRCAVLVIGEDKDRPWIGHRPRNAAASGLGQPALIGGDIDSTVVGTDRDVPEAVLGLEVALDRSTYRLAVLGQGYAID